MKKALTALLASLMLAGALAGAMEPACNFTSSLIVSLGEGCCPTPVSSPRVLSYGESTPQ